MRTKSSKKNKINIITLGCSKNIYDSEVLVESKNTYIRVGDFANVIVKNADHFDLYGVVAD